MPHNNPKRGEIWKDSVVYHNGDGREYVFITSTNKYRNGIKEVTFYVIKNPEDICNYSINLFLDYFRYVS